MRNESRAELVPKAFEADVAKVFYGKIPLESKPFELNGQTG